MYISSLVVFVPLASLQRGENGRKCFPEILIIPVCYLHNLFYYACANNLQKKIKFLLKSIFYSWIWGMKQKVFWHKWCEACQPHILLPAQSPLSTHHVHFGGGVCKSCPTSLSPSESLYLSSSLNGQSSSLINTVDVSPIHQEYQHS